jgi:hypothetical protein
MRRSRRSEERLRADAHQDVAHADLIADIRSRFLRLTDMTLTGAIEESGKPDCYLCWGADYRCDAERPDRFVVYLEGVATRIMEYDIRLQLGRTWTDVDAPDAASGCQRILVTLLGGAEDLELRFRSLLIEPSGVMRRYFESQYGKVVWHTRPSGENVDTCAELGTRGDFVRFLWEPALPGFRSDTIQRVDSVPF